MPYEVLWIFFPIGHESHRRFLSKREWLNKLEFLEELSAHNVRSGIREETWVQRDLYERILVVQARDGGGPSTLRIHSERTLAWKMIRLYF